MYISGIEPSKKGGKLIAEGIHHVGSYHQSGTISRFAKLPGAITYASINSFPNCIWCYACLNLMATQIRKQSSTED